MKFCYISLLLLFSFIGSAKSQENKTYLEESKPLSPGAYQFLKYTALPVSEYTGIPEVSVPVYEIKEDGVIVPITLNYHASGITVNEEATSVGLGWNLQFGSVVQIVNDQSDLNPQKTKQLPDYIGSSIPSELPLRYPWPFILPGGPTSFPVGPISADYRFPIATNNYFPINGDYNTFRYDLFNNFDYDSEPDIFKANFLGYSINFIKDFKNGGKIVVLNKAGYKVEYLTDDSWCITVPSGEQYFFALKNVTSSAVSASSTGGPNSNPSYSVNDESSVMWSLTKIITKNKREIIFNYIKTNSFSHFPNFSQSWKKARVLESRNLGYSDVFRGFWNTSIGTTSTGNLTTTIFLQSESHVVPSSILFPLGRIDFYNSDRDDVLGGKKIDSVALSADRLHKVFKLQYSYFNSSAVGGNGFAYNTVTYGDRAALRLKLNNFIDETGGIYQFNYNPELLPSKNSYALDQWGYYNGTLNNTSLIPNPTQYNKPELGDNGNNHSAKESYAKASLLNQIIYPTGGSVNFDFELNTFSNYWVPDYDNSDNTISHGNGVRVKKITWKQKDNSISKMQQINYQDGKALLPINLYRNYEHPTGTGAYSNIGAGAYFSTVSYFVDEFDANGYYSPSSFASINAVGYDQVTSKYVDQNDNSLGTVVTIFNNTPATLPVNSVQFMTKVNVSVPARENWDLPKNGSVKSVQYLDQQGNVRKKTTTIYSNFKSGLFYGARISGYGNYIAFTPPTGGVGEWTGISQYMVAEYPIYDFESLPGLITDVDYFAVGDSLKTSISTDYDPDRLLANSVVRGANFTEKTTYAYSVLPAMIAQNRISDITYTYKSKISTSEISYDRGVDDAHTFQRTFVQIGDKFLPSSDVEKNANQSAKTTITYDSYDEKGNVSQLTDQGGTTSLIWSYDRKYLIASVRNALRIECAHTGFEQKILEVSGDWIIFPSIQQVNRPPLILNSYKNDAHTGAISTNANAIESKTLPSKDYLFTLYAKGEGTVTVNGISQTISGNWKRYDWYLPAATKVSVQNINNVMLDDFSVYPSAAQMITYTYDPLVGMTSITDEKGKISFYEYDNFKRLKNVKDQNGNIVKSYEYHTAGQF